ncbi:Sucrose-phosphate synthase [Thalictrum thalictroides]|uniref:Sucrose-phosphate synthase n=1 Tax=Thalictrum thalictroides TaxID=46969 RepID=A0A7J6VRM6_THATH|nr:Sucrose-phosphate synthase [Thalictrum thalictroides]
MAKNEWINGYLEAILDAGGSKKDASWISNTNSLFSPTKYFVEEVVNRFDDTDLHRTWVKVIATRNSRERNNRLENMCWRIWHLARKKKQIAWDDAHRLAKRRLEREEGRKDASEDLSELSEGEKEKGDTSQHGDKEKLFRIKSELKMWSDEDKSKRLYIVLISLHGLVRGDNMELGRDSDTGGQVKYVVELARALANTKGVYRVDLLTRQISSSDVDSSYGEPIEMISSPSDTDAEGEGCGAYIIRLPCGPRDRYIPKESLWPYIPEFVDEALSHVVNMARVIGDQVEGGKPIWPYVIHGHYADAGEVAAYLSGSLNVPMVLTGHSLGRNKFEQLLQQGRLTREDINTTYKIMRRIEAEEFGLDAAEMVVTSTRQEIEEQWGLYDGFDVKLERKLRVRRRRGVSCLGRNMPRMVVIPPGMDFSYVKMQDSIDNEDDLSSLLGSDSTENKKNLPPIWSEIMRFFTNPHKPMILALSRPDPKKNVTTLLKAFGECKHLRELANLTLILGNRDDIEEMSNTSSVVLTTVLTLIDKYDLYGQVAYPKHHKQSDVPEIYRLAAKTKGVFINPALVEPFGLTLIEASAYGLPTVATKNGGPVDIHKALNNGLLVDPHDQKAIADALLKLVAGKGLWLECRKNGLKNIHRFSWPEHCKNYLSHIEHCRDRHSTPRLEIVHQNIEEPMSDSLRDVEDLSLRFSIDGDFKVNGELDPASRQKELIDTLIRRQQSTTSSNVAFKSYGPGKRLRLFVVAVDCYHANGVVSNDSLSMIIKTVLAAASDPAGKTGFLISTGSTLAETMEALRSCQLDPSDFDALICSSGSELYYPWRDLVADVDYSSHVEYRWPGDNVRSTIMRLARLDDEADDGVAEYVYACGSHCYAYMVKPGAKALKTDDLRHKLRMRGFRCNLVYTRAATRLNVVPLFASRLQALRYLSVRWGVDLSKMVVFVGEKGDTDYEDLLVGIHKTLILNGSVENGSEVLLRSGEVFRREDIVPKDSPNIAFVKEGFVASDITLAVDSFGT